MGQAVMLKWTTKGVEGIKALITEINNYTYTNLEVLDLTGTPPSFLFNRSSYGRRRSPPTLPRLHSILLYGNDITSTGANTLLSAFKYLPQVELLGLEFLRNFQKPTTHR